MNNNDLTRILAGLTTPHIADACLKKKVEVRCAPAGIRPVSLSNCRFAGMVRPAGHSGSVDVFLEALEKSEPGEVLVVDNSGRLDEACIGDLVAFEAKKAGIVGIVVWGLHRDTVEITEIGSALGRFRQARSVSTQEIRTRFFRPASVLGTSPRRTWR